MEKLEQPDFIGIADYEYHPSWESPEWKSLNREFATVVVDDLLEFLWEYYMPL